MRFSYRVRDQCLLKSICLPIEREIVCLVTGVENAGFGLIGGIVAGLLPIKEKLPWAQLQELIVNYTGTVTVKEGKLPERAVYVGPDPDHNLLLSKVSEELETRLPAGAGCAELLESVGLNDSFYTRPVRSLSGGEKMKLCLALAFSKPYDCYVLHGVIPWLDQNGRELLVKKVESLRKRACIIFLEHETYPLSDIADVVIEFDGITSAEKEKNTYFRRKGTDYLHASGGLATELGKVVQLTDVTFMNYADSELQRTSPLLDVLSLDLFEQRVYAITGANGAGKSTLAKLIFRVVRADSGEILLCGKHVEDYERAELCELISYVGQFPERQIIYDNIEQYKINARKSRNALSLDLMEKWLRLDDKHVATLTVFEMKLLLLTGFVTEKTRLIILDEPSWGLSEFDIVKLFSLLEEIHRKLRCTLVIITHNNRLAQSVAADVFHLREGKAFIGKGKG